MKVIRKRLTADEITPPNIRYDADCDCTQFTPDGGTTWVDQPSLDPRTSTVYQLPADPTENPKCDAAERAIDQLHDELDGVIAALDAAQAVNFLFDAVLILVPGFGQIAGIIWLAVEALLFISQAAINYSFTDEVYDNLKCLWYCRVGADGIMTPDGLTAWQDDVQTAYPTDAVIPATISIVVDNFGLVQLNNAAVKRTETGDCETCECPLPLTLAIYTSGGFTYGADLVQVSDFVWECSSNMNNEGTGAWLLLVSADYIQTFKVLSKEVVSGLSTPAGQWTTQSYPTPDFGNGDPLAAAWLRGFGYSQAGVTAWRFRFTVERVS